MLQLLSRCFPTLYLPIRRPLHIRPRLVSQVCTESQLLSADFVALLEQMREPMQLHRKLWEWAYIAQALKERGLLKPGLRGLGFAVGTEPLASLFASMGCDILATDLAPSQMDHQQSLWMSTGQHATSLTSLNTRGVCPAEEFEQRVRFRFADMNDLPDDLGTFDFLWSSCSFEHLGTLEHGQRFMENALRFLKPGGIGVHTTEFNVESNGKTIESGPDVLYRRRDIETMALRVAKRGGRMIERDYNVGASESDRHVDRAPYGRGPHLKLDYNGFVITSIGLIVEKTNPTG